MAVELTREMRSARWNLTSDLARLKNASVRIAERVRQREKGKNYSDDKNTNTDDLKNWISTCVFCLVLFLILSIELLERYGIISELLSLLIPR